MILIKSLVLVLCFSVVQKNCPCEHILCVGAVRCHPCDMTFGGRNVVSHASHMDSCHVLFEGNVRFFGSNSCSRRFDAHLQVRRNDTVQKKKEISK